MNESMPNITSKYSIIIDRPLSEVFQVLARGDPESLERTWRGAPLCTDFTLLHEDMVAFPASTPRLNVRIRSLQSHTDSGVEHEGLRILPRRFFQFEETATMLFGYVSRKVTINAAVAWDDDARVGYYEGVVEGPSLNIWKVKEFEEVGGGEGEDEGKKPRTKVTETLAIICPWWMHFYVQPEALRSHR
jgi:hypothetical protein